MRGGVLYLVDTSAVVRWLRGEGAEHWQRAVASSQVGMCDVTELEHLYSMRSARDRDRVLDVFAASFPWIPMPDRVFDRAREVQRLLTERSWHRSAGPIDLLVAATAELSELALVHQDRDFETIAQVTGQPTRWLMPSLAPPEAAADDQE